MSISPWLLAEKQGMKYYLQLLHRAYIAKHFKDPVTNQPGFEPTMFWWGCFFVGSWKKFREVDEWTLEKGSPENWPGNDKLQLFKRRYIFKCVFSHCHVSFRGSKSSCLEFCHYTNEPQSFAIPFVQKRLTKTKPMGTLYTQVECHHAVDVRNPGNHVRYTQSL